MAHIAVSRTGRFSGVTPATNQDFHLRFDGFNVLVSLDELVQINRQIARLTTPADPEIPVSMLEESEAVI